MDLREIGGGSGPGASGGKQRRHPWEVARARFFGELVRDRGSAARALRVLDVGAGDGYLAGALLSQLPAGSRCLCVDAHYTDDHLRELPRACAKGVAFARAAPPGERYDMLLMLDVLEHVEDDLSLLRSYAPFLAPGGYLVASVPAFMALYSKHDAFLGHYRRYRPAELCSLARAGGFDVIASGSLFHSLLPVRALQKAREYASGHRAQPPGRGEAAFVPGAQAGNGGSELAAWRGGPALSWLVQRALATDSALSRVTSRLGMSLPGLSAWVWARRA